MAAAAATVADTVTVISQLACCISVIVWLKLLLSVNSSGSSSKNSGS